MGAHITLRRRGKLEKKSKLERFFFFFFLCGANLCAVRDAGEKGGVGIVIGIQISQPLPSAAEVVTAAAILAGGSLLVDCFS